MSAPTGSPRAQARGDHQRRAQTRCHQVEQSGQPLALRPQADVRPHSTREPALDERIGERIRLQLGRVRDPQLDLLGAQRHGSRLPPRRARLQRELLELPEQPLASLADVGDDDPGRIGVQLESEARAL